MFMEVMWYLHDNKWLGSQNICILRPTALFKNKAKWAFIVSFVTVYCFHDVNHTISRLGRPITAEFTKGFSIKTSLINILCL